MSKKQPKKEKNIFPEKQRIEVMTNRVSRVIYAAIDRLRVKGKLVSAKVLKVKTGMRLVTCQKYMKKYAESAVKGFKGRIPKGFDPFSSLLKKKPKSKKPKLNVEAMLETLMQVQKHLLEKMANIEKAMLGLLQLSMTKKPKKAK